MSLLLKNALIIDPHSKHHRKRRNILIENGFIASLSSDSADEVVDCGTLSATPGWLDLNAGFCDPGLEFKEDIESGASAAQYGGFTDVHLIPQTQPVIDSKSDVEYILSKPIQEVDLHVSASVSEDQKGENLTEMMDLHHHGARSFSDADHPIWNAELLIKALQYTSRLEGISIFQNARDVHISQSSYMHEGIVSTKLGLRGEPSLSEELMVGRDIDILRYSGGRLHFTKVSSTKSLALIRAAKDEGLDITCDVAIHHLIFNDASVGDFDTNYKSLPPFRSEKDRKALIKAVIDGTIDGVCSNHRPQGPESKLLAFDLAEPGTISIQTFYPALLKIEEIPLETLVEKITHGPRKILGLEPIVLEEGAVAKLTLLNPNDAWELNEKSNRSKSSNSPFWNQTLMGRVCGTINSESITFFQ